MLKCFMCLRVNIDDESPSNPNNSCLGCDEGRILIRFPILKDGTII